MAICKYRISKTAFFILLACLTITSNVYAVNKICYRGLRSGKALLNVNGRLVQLSPGQSNSKYGLKLITANKDTITVKVDGKRYQYKKNVSWGTILAEELKLTPASNGNYMADGKLNGKNVTFVVDTGASFISMNRNMARALNINPGNQTVQSQTASGMDTSYLVMLDSVSVGDIKMYNVQATISKHDYPIEPLLGMSFLQNVDMSQKDGQMVLKYSN
ncbi:MAG: retropepsin-like aspartic protease family protein [Planctomycetota bacterium]